MSLLKKLIAQLVKHEGLELKPYVDTVGKTTIGVGRNLTDVGINKEEADFLLMNDLKVVHKELFDAFPWMNELSENRKIVFMNMCFNMGLPRLRKFQNTIRFARIGHYEESAREMLDSKWARQVGNRALELSLIMATGEIITKE